MKTFGVVDKMDQYITDNSVFHDWTDITISPNVSCPNGTKNPYLGDGWIALEITMWCILGLAITFR